MRSQSIFSPKRLTAVLAFALAFGLFLTGCDNAPLGSQEETEPVATESSDLRTNSHEEAGDELDRLCEVVPLDVVQVLDRSGSMRLDNDGDGDSKLEEVKAASKNFVDRLTPSDRAGLVSFSSNAVLEQSLTDDFAALKTAIDGLTAFGSTAIGAGVEKGRSDINDNGRPDATPVLIVLGNGLENEGTNPRDKAQAAKDDGIRVITIAFGDGADTDLLEDMASEPKDENFFVSGTDNIEDVFETITQELCPQQVDIDIKPGSDPNSININNDGNIPVGVFTTNEFDATEIDPETVRFGTFDQITSEDGGAGLAHGGHYEDVVGDDRDDFLGHHPTEDVGFESGDDIGWLIGKTKDGDTFVGHDTVRILDLGGGGPMRAKP